MSLPRGYSRSPEYLCWRHMKTRCLNRNFKHFKHYGGRGITVCDRWRDSFEAFLIDVGPRPSPKHTIDRYPDNDGNYEPGNVRWATRKQQQENTRRTRPAIVNGKTVPLAEACRLLNLNEGAVRCRVQSGWPIGRALATPIGKHVVLSDKQRREIRKIRGMSQDRIAAIYGVAQSVISEIRHGRRRRNERA
jgi:hypothetical protein